MPPTFSRNTLSRDSADTFIRDIKFQYLKVLFRLLVATFSHIFHMQSNQQGFLLVPKEQKLNMSTAPCQKPETEGFLRPA